MRVFPFRSDGGGPGAGGGTVVEAEVDGAAVAPGAALAGVVDAPAAGAGVA